MPITIPIFILLLSQVNSFTLRYPSRVETRSGSLSMMGKTDEPMNTSLSGCICLVTGASRGIGKGIAIELGYQGATVYVTGTTTSATPESPGTITETAHLVTEMGGQGVAVVCDHSNDENVKALMKQIEEEHGRLDMLINNAFRLPSGGVKELNKKFWELDLSMWDSLHQVGLRSHFTASYFAMPLLLKSAKSSARPIPRPFIGMIGSFGGLSYTFNLPYGVGKAGVDRLAKDMAFEVKDEDICVVSFWPGLVRTERTEISVENGDWDKYVGLPLDSAESPRFTGRAIIAVATDDENLKKSGTYQVVAELANAYGFSDVDGSNPPSIRSLKFLLPSYGFDKKIKERIPVSWIPDWKLPFWLMAQGQPPQSD